LKAAGLARGPGVRIPPPPFSLVQALRDLLHRSISPKSKKYFTLLGEVLSDGDWRIDAIR
jgi:hypothetical protein